MTVNLSSLHVYAGPVISIIAGILILITPKILNYVVAFYLIIMGILGLAPFLHLH
jgi:hypothetical protein